MRKNLLGRIRKGEPFSWGDLLLLTWQLSVPAIMAKITTVMMQYIDASMVGMIGAGAAASIVPVRICGRAVWCAMACGRCLFSAWPWGC